jgi:hypothetical protein
MPKLKSMKYKVIAKIMDGVVIANKNNIICVDESTIRDNKGEDSLYWGSGIYIGMILSDKNINNADTFWHYSKREWDFMNKEFQNIK